MSISPGSTPSTFATSARSASTREPKSSDFLPAGSGLSACDSQSSTRLAFSTDGAPLPVSQAQSVGLLIPSSRAVALALIAKRLRAASIRSPQSLGSDDLPVGGSPRNRAALTTAALSGSTKTQPTARSPCQVTRASIGAISRPWISIDISVLTKSAPWSSIRHPVSEILAIVAGCGLAPSSRTVTSSDNRWRRAPRVSAVFAVAEEYLLIASNLSTKC